MPGNTDSIFQTSNPRKKPKILPIFNSKKARSKIPRRKRVLPFPIIMENELSSGKSSAFQTTSFASACFNGEGSCDCSLNSVASVNPKKRQRFKENEVAERSRFACPGSNSRPITRSYRRRKGNVSSKENKESPFIGSISPEEGRNCVPPDISAARNLTQTIRSRKEASEAEKCEDMFFIEPLFSENFNLRSRCREGNEAAQKNEAFTASKVCSAHLSDASCLESLSVSNTLNEAKAERSIAVSASTVDLACSEELSNGDDASDYSSCGDMTLSQLEAEIFPKNSMGDYIAFSQPSVSSILGESSDESEKAWVSSTPSVWFSLFSQYMREFSGSNSCRLLQAYEEGIENEYSDEFTLMRFESGEYEESFKIFRIRERRRECRFDCTKEYGPATKHGTLVLQQRLLMVNWMVEHANAHELHYETLFLGVSLLDRFLSRGFFKSKRKLQLLGISCCTLATRIEENQPRNSIREKQFQVGTNIFSRYEVVAMEWLVQDILDFQCFLPTIYHFLWFYLKAARANLEVQDCVKYLAVLSLLDHERLSFWPSTVAAGLVILASLATNRESSCQRVMETHVRTKDDDLPECIQSLEWLVKYVC